MSTSVNSFVCGILLARHPPSRGINAGRRRWRRLGVSLRDPYRPEMHYMRGPGPKWREKYGHGDRPIGQRLR